MFLVDSNFHLSQNLVTFCDIFDVLKSILGYIHVKNFVGSIVTVSC